jgi:hypothetical protein
MTAEQLGSIAGIVLSLLFSYVPGLAGWFAALTTGYKQMIMGVLLIAVAGAIYGLACANLYGGIVCGKEGGLQLINILIAALISNQSAYLLTRK